MFIGHNASAHDLPKVLAAWTAVLKRHGPQAHELTMTSAELGHKHSMACRDAERELSDKLRDIEVSEGVRKVILARFFSIEDLRVAYSSCASLEQRQQLCAPLLHAQLQELSLSKQEALHATARGQPGATCNQTRCVTRRRAQLNAACNQTPPTTRRRRQILWQ